MNNDLISREYLIKAVEDLYEYAELDEVLDVIKEAPAVGALDTDDEPKTSRQKRALEIIDALKADRLIGYGQRGILRRAILDNTPEVPSNMTLIPTDVLDELTSTSRGVGEWQGRGIAIQCSKCSAMYSVAFYEICYDHLEFHYCPNCGALMVNNGGD